MLMSVHMDYFLLIFLIKIQSQYSWNSTDRNNNENKHFTITKNVASNFSGKLKLVSENVPSEVKIFFK